jgi:hypothetical protein
MDAVVPLLIFVPLLSLLGGITLAILRTVGRQRQIELLQRERIAALERGLDPAQLPSLGVLGIEPAACYAERLMTLARGEALVIYNDQLNATLADPTSRLGTVAPAPACATSARTPSEFSFEEAHVREQPCWVLEVRVAGAKPHGRVHRHCLLVLAAGV